MTVKHEATPIDEKAAIDLAESLKKEFSKSALVRDYSIMETKIFDFAPKAKGVLIYTSFRLNDVNMMQMHVLVSGSEKQFLQTYTDMGSRFSSTDAGFTQAWTSITAIQVKGAAPSRYENAIKVGSVAGVFFFVLAFVAVIRHRGRKKSFQASVMALESDEYADSATSHVVSNAWAMSADEASSDNDDMPATKINSIDAGWQVSAAVMTKKSPKIRMKPKVDSEENNQSDMGASAGSDWVLPVRTRVSPNRVSVG